MTASGDQLRLRLYEAFDLLWSAHLEGKPSGETFLANRKALVRSLGGKFLDEITPFDYRKHRRDRLSGQNGHRQVGVGSVFHDHGLLNLLYSKLEEWQIEGLKPEGIDLSRLALPKVLPTYGSKKSRPAKRRVVWLAEEFLAVAQKATDRCRRSMEALVDLDIREGDLSALRPNFYNPYNDQIEWTQAKTGKDNAIPVTDRVRQHFIEAKALGREFVYDLTNLRKEFEEARRAAVKASQCRPIVTKRDLRKTAYNAVLRFSGQHRIAGMMAGHTTTRTGIDFYEVEFREDLKPVVAFLEKTYRSS